MKEKEEGAEAEEEEEETAGLVALPAPPAAPLLPLPLLPPFAFAPETTASTGPLSFLLAPVRLSQRGVRYAVRAHVTAAG